MSDQSYPYGSEDQHLPHESWHIVQQKSRRRRVSLRLDGAEFLGYPSPSNNTYGRFPEWQIKVSQGNWGDEITPFDNPLHSPNLEGSFEIEVQVKCENGEFKVWKNKNGSPTTTVECGKNENIMVVFYATSETGCEGEYYCLKTA